FISLIDQGKNLDYNTSIQHLEEQHLINERAQSRSQGLRTASFDNYDIRNNGVDVYNIIGCQTGTFSKFTENIQSDHSVVYDFPKVTTGDGTVPLLSAQTIPADSNKIFFYQKADHGKLPSADGVKELITNILMGSALDTGPHIF